MPKASKYSTPLPIPTIPIPPPSAIVDQYRPLSTPTRSVSLPQPSPASPTLSAQYSPTFLLSPLQSRASYSGTQFPATTSPAHSPLLPGITLPGFDESPLSTAHPSLLFNSQDAHYNETREMSGAAPRHPSHSPQLPLFTMPPHSASPRMQLSKAQHLHAVIESIEEHFKFHGGFGGFLNTFMSPDAVSSTHEHMRTAWLSGNTNEKLINFVQSIYSHFVSRPSANEKECLFDAERDLNLIKSTRVALSIWATRIVGQRCVAEVGKLGFNDAKHPEFPARIQVSVNARSTAKKTVSEADIFTWNMQRTITAFETLAKTTWFLTKCMAAPRKKGQVELRKKRPHPFIQAAAISMFTICRNKSANGHFALAFGAWLFSSKTPTNVKHVLCRLGLSVHDTTIRHALDAIAEIRRQHLQQMTAASLNTKQPYCRLILDNIQKYQIVFKHGIGQASQMITGTAGTALRLDNCAPNAFDLETYQKAYVKNERTHLTTASLHDDIDFDHLRRVFALHFVHILCEYVPTLKPYLELVSQRFRSAPVAKHPVKPRKTHIIPLGANAHNEMETSGMKEAVKDFDRQVGYTSENVSKAGIQIWNAGDVGSELAFWRVMRHLLGQAASRNAYDSFENRIFTFGLFHTRMHIVNGISETHFGARTTQDPSSVSRAAMATDLYIPTNPSSCDFYPTTRTLETVFKAQVLDLWDLELTSHTGLLSHFEAAALSNKIPQFDELFSAAESLVDRYASTRAFDTAMSAARHESCPPLLRFTAGRPAPARQSTSNDGDLEFTGDQCLANSILFRRHFLMYLELSYAVTEGDTGRIMEILKLLIFFFAGASKQHYTTALLEMYCMLRYEASPELIDATLDNWLVCFGEPGTFIEDDHLQEHHIRWLIEMLARNGNSFDEPFFRNIISSNVRFFLDIKEEFAKIFNLKSNSKAHTSADVEDEIRTLMKMFREEKLHYFEQGRNFGYVANDYIDRGYSSLDSGKLRDFLDVSTNRAQVLASLRKINTTTTPPQPSENPAPNSSDDDSNNESDVDDELRNESEQAPAWLFRMDTANESEEDASEESDEQHGNSDGDMELDG